MPNIPLGTRFIGIAPEVNLTERKSALINRETQPYLIEDISSSTGGSVFIPRDIYFGGTNCADVSIIDDYSINNSTSESITAPNLLSIDGEIYLSGSGSSAGLKTISMPLLETISVWAIDNIPGWSENSIYISYWGNLESIDFGSLTTVKGDIYIYNNDNLNFIDISNLESIQNDTPFEITSNVSLETLDISSLTTFNGYFNMYNNAFTQATVDAILYQLAEVVELSNNQVNLNGGTNAAPSVTGDGYVATLTANGCTVTTN
jgi:hypothetical protein